MIENLPMRLERRRRQIAPRDAIFRCAELAWLSSRPPQASLVARCARNTVLERHGLSQMAASYAALYDKLLATRRQAEPAPVSLASG